MSNIYFHPSLPMVEALRLAHAQGARLVWRSGRVRMAAAGPDGVQAIGALIATIDRALEQVARQDCGGALAVLRSARALIDTEAAGAE